MSSFGFALASSNQEGQIAPLNIGSNTRKCSLVSDLTLAVGCQDASHKLTTTKVGWKLQGDASSQVNDDAHVGFLQEKPTGRGGAPSTKFLIKSRKIFYHRRGN